MKNDFLLFSLVFGNNTTPNRRFFFFQAHHNFPSLSLPSDHTFPPLFFFHISGGGTRGGELNIEESKGKGKRKRNRTRRRTTKKRKGEVPIAQIYLLWRKKNKEVWFLTDFYRTNFLILKICNLILYFHFAI